MYLPEVGIYYESVLMSLDVWAPMLTSNLSFCNKSLRAHNIVAHVELLRGDARPVPRYVVTVNELWEPITQDIKQSCPSKKKSKAKSKSYNNDFRKIIISNLIPDALRDLHTSKYKRPLNKPSDGCLCKPAKRNSVRTSKQLRFVASTETFNGNQAL